MKIHRYKNLLSGLFILALSFIPFSLMNYADKVKIENCEEISGSIADLDDDKGGSGKTGYLLKIKRSKIKIRIVGDAFAAIENEKQFEALMKPGTRVTVHFLRPEFYSLFERLNSSPELKDAMHIVVDGKVLLDIEDIKSRLKNYFGICLLLGIICLAVGANYIRKSLKPLTGI